MYFEPNLSLKTQGQPLSWEELQLQQQHIISSSTRSIFASKFTKFRENLGTSTSNISNVTTTIIPVFATPLGSRGSYWYIGGSILLSSDIDTATITATAHYQQQHHNVLLKCKVYSMSSAPGCCCKRPEWASSNQLQYLRPIHHTESTFRIYWFRRHNTKTNRSADYRAIIINPLLKNKFVFFHRFARRCLLLRSSLKTMHLKRCWSLKTIAALKNKEAVVFEL